MEIVLRIESINLFSKNDDMQKVIIETYGNFLNSLTIPIEIIFKTSEHDIERYNIGDLKLKSFIRELINKSDTVKKEIFVKIQNDKKNLVETTVYNLKKILGGIGIECEEVSSKYVRTGLVNDFKAKYAIINDSFTKSMIIYNWPHKCYGGWMEFLYNLGIKIDVRQVIIPKKNNEMLKLLEKKLRCVLSNYEDIEEEYAYDVDAQNISRMINEVQLNDGKIFLSTYIVTVKGNSIDELNSNFSKVKSLLTSRSISVNELIYQHHLIEDVIGKSQNYAIRNSLYNFPTSTLKMFFPFLINSLNDKNGSYIGMNLENNDLLFLDLFKRQYAVILIMGLMGSGKSYLAKHLINVFASNGIEITIFDKSGEYNIFKGKKNINIYSNKSNDEYLSILKEYNKQIDNDYISGNLKPRLFVMDEAWSYIQNEGIKQILLKMILEGRKKYLATMFMTQFIESFIGNSTGDIILKASNIKFLMKMFPNEAKLVSKEFYLNDAQQAYITTCSHQGILMVNSNSFKFTVKTIDEYNDLYNTDPSI